MNFVPQRVTALLRIGGLWGTRRKLLETTAPGKIPKTLVMIFDGNRRYAEYLGYGEHEQTIGHEFGYANGKKLIRAAFAYGVTNVVVWAASKANFDERKMDGMRRILKLFGKEVREQLATTPVPGEEYHFRVCGEEWLKYCYEDPELPELVRQLEAKTAKYDTKRTLTLLFGYCGRQDVLHAAKSVAKEALARGWTEKQIDELITEETLGTYMLSHWVGDVDMVIRTGEKEREAHWSQCLLAWWMEKTEFFFTATLLPVLSVAELYGMFVAFAKRRKLGGK